MPTTRYDDTIIDELIWQAIRDSGCPADFRDYLDHRPENAMHLDEALDRLVELDDADATDADSARGFPAAVAAIEALANSGDATAQFHMGKLLDKGIGVPPDIGRSIAWYRLAILQGELRSHINLAGTLRTGNATPADCAEARDLYAKAAERGEPMGLFLLARLMAGGTHEESAQPDPVRAFQMFHQAWEAGDSAAGHWIGHMLATGKGVRRDEAMGREWIVKAAEAGCIGAILQLGREAESGRADSAERGLPRDSASWRWFMRRGGVCVRISTRQGAGWKRPPIRATVKRRRGWKMPMRRKNPPYHHRRLLSRPSRECCRWRCRGWRECRRRR